MPQRTFREVYEENFAFVYRLLVVQYGLPERNAEDAAQIVFVRFHERFDEWDQTRSVRSYLWGFARRVGSEMRRLASSRREVFPGEDAPDRGDPGSTAEHEAMEARQVVERAMAELDEDHQDILAAVDMEELSVPEAAEQLGIKLNTAYSRLGRAREQFTNAVRRLSGSTR